MCENNSKAPTLPIVREGSDTLKFNDIRVGALEGVPPARVAFSVSRGCPWVRVFQFLNIHSAFVIAAMKSFMDISCVGTVAISLPGGIAVPLNPVRMLTNGPPSRPSCSSDAAESERILFLVALLYPQSQVNASARGFSRLCWFEGVDWYRPVFRRDERAHPQLIRLGQVHLQRVDG
jgi:hypothetical protein